MVIVPKILTHFVFQRVAKEKKKISLIIFEYLKYFDYTDLKYVKNFVMCLQMFLPSLCLKTRDSGNSPDGTAAVRYTNQHRPPQRCFKHSTPRSTTWLKPLLISAQDSSTSIGLHTRILYNWNFTRYYIIHLPLAP